MKSLWEMSVEEFWEAIYRPRQFQYEWIWEMGTTVEESEEQVEMMDTDPGWEDLKPSDQMVVIRRVTEDFVRIRKMCLPKWKVWLSDWLGVWG